MKVANLGEGIEGELRDGKELVRGDEALGSAIELAEAIVESDNLLLRN